MAAKKEEYVLPSLNARMLVDLMMFVGTAVTAEETAALGLHYEIIAAAQTAAAGLLDMARKIKRMRDTGGYKALGFESLEAYTQATMGMRQRQAYNYISIAEKLPAQLIEQNAAAGVTKLALLASLTAGEQKQITAETDLAGTTVTALKRQIRELQEKNTGYAQQLSLLQANAEDDRQTARRDAQETVRRDLEAAVQRQKEAEAAAKQDRRERDAALAAAEKLKAEAAQHKKALEKARAQGAAEAAEKARAEVRMENEARLNAEKAAREAAEADGRHAGDDQRDRPGVPAGYGAGRGRPPAAVRSCVCAGPCRDQAAVPRRKGQGYS